MIPRSTPIAPDDLHITAEIGEGSSAVVYRARRQTTGEIVALKQWRGVLDPAERARFLREVDVLRELAGHPNIVGLKDAQAPEDGPAWLVTELCEESLAHRLMRGPVPLAEAFAIADDILCGLEAIHAAGHLHRDLKPQNVLLNGSRAKLCDLGLTGPVGLQTSNRSAGTAPYVAPELAAAQPSELSDIYAAALTLDQVFGDEAPRDVQKLLVRASSSKPGDRVPNARALRKALADLAVAPADPSRPSEPRTPDESVGPPTPDRGRGRLILVAALAALLVGGGTTAWATGVVDLTRDGSKKIDTALQTTTPTASSSAPAVPGAPTPAGTPSSSMTASPSRAAGLPAGDTTTTSGGRVPVGLPSGNPGSASSGGGSTGAGDRSPAKKQPIAGKTTVPAAASKTSKQKCLDASTSGGLTIPENGTNSGGPNFVPRTCTAIYLQLTDVSRITYARACLETPAGSTTSCGSWVFLEDMGAWNTLRTGVSPGTRWRLDMKADGTESVSFLFSNG